MDVPIAIMAGLSGTPRRIFDPYKLSVHRLNLLLSHIRLVDPEPTSKGMRNMHEFVDKNLNLLFFAELIKPLRNNLNNIMRSLVEG